MSTPAVAPTPLRSFLFNLSLVVMLAVSALFTGLAVSDQRGIEAELLMRGRVVFNAIVLMRKWNALHGGVFVEKTPGMISNPYLEHPDRVGTDGTVYTLKNPALMTREVSEIAEREGAFKFHITSLRPLNPGNAPDAFERDALQRFEHGTTEATIRERRDGTPWFRFMAPLKVESACLKCHAKQGYHVGDIRGGISVSYSSTEADAAIRRMRWTVLGLFAATSLLLLAVLWRLVDGLRGRLLVAEARIRELASTDDLTGLANRRRIGERLQAEQSRAGRYLRPLSVALLDLDHFKAVNDTHGHDAGDAVLRATARTLSKVLRDSDVLGRWGGEEFLAVLPETDPAGARAVAERLRVALAAQQIEHAGRTLGATLSVGVATWTPPAKAGEQPDIAALVKQADEALYRAKHAGRNRVEA